MHHRLILSAAVLGAFCACAPARAEKVRQPQGVLVQTPQASPYKVEVLSAAGQVLPTYQRGSRHYVLGEAGGRYIIRVTNPTDQRIEAVVSVDGLDVIDGQVADFRTKRGYVVPAHGEVRIEGFRTSTSQVAAFRFSSVPRSYAARKGLPRNIGVIGVAIFQEAARPVMVRPDRRPHPHWQPPPPPHYHPLGDRDTAGVSAQESAPAPESSGRSARGKAAANAAPTTSRGTRCCNPYPNIDRPGLGTEFGERRYSAVTWTRFVRKNPARPDAVATLRYNDAAGLRALGIPVEPTPNAHEVWIRETANPFPHSGFAEPPR